MSEIYVSTDVETDGWIPGPHSMLSLASAAFTADKKMVSTFSVNLETLPGATQMPDNKAFWDRNPEAWAACRENLVAPSAAMASYANWLVDLGGTPIFVGKPMGFDYMFVAWYLLAFAKCNPFGFQAIDMRTYLMAMKKSAYQYTKYEERWFSEHPHTHVALDDAIEQGELFMNMFAENMGT